LVDHPVRGHGPTHTTPTEQIGQPQPVQGVAGTQQERAQHPGHKTPPTGDHTDQGELGSAGEGEHAEEQGLHGREPGSHRCGAESQAGDAHGDTDPQAVTHRWGTECGERFHVGHSRKLGTTFLCPVGAKQARGSDSVPDGTGKCTYQACSRSGSSTAGRTAPVSSTSSGYGAFARPALPCLWWACTHMNCSYGCPVPPAQRGECDP